MKLVHCVTGQKKVKGHMPPVPHPPPPPPPRSYAYENLLGSIKYAPFLSTVNTARCTHRCLDHQYPLLPQVGDELKDADGVLCLHPLHHGVQCDEGACPAHTSTAVHQEEVLPAVRMCLPHSLDEVDHGDGIGRNSMVRPG